MKYQAAALALLLNTSTVLAGVQRRDGSDRRWGQCAGQDYNGPTDCPSGWTCQLQNSYYSQCLQGGGSGGNPSGSGSGSGSGSVSNGYSNGTGSVSTGSTGSGTDLSGSGSKVGVSSPASSPSSSLPGGVASSGTTATGTNTGAETEANGDDDDSEGTCDAEDEDDSTSSTTPAVAPAGKLAAQVTTGGGAAGKLAGSTTGGESSDGVASGGSGTSSASGSGASGDPTTEVKAVKQSDTEDSDTTGSDTTESGSGNTTGSGSSSSSNPNAGTTNSGISPGSALATTTQYGPITDTSPGSCGCAGSWQNGADNITTAAGGPSINDGYCGAGCGACYLLTSTGQAPCAGDACKVSAASQGATLTVMVTNSCPTQGNDVWCSVPNRYGYGAHFDLARQPEGWGNVVVSYAPTPCPGSLTSNWNTCKCAGKSTPHEGLVASGGKTSVA